VKCTTFLLVVGALLLGAVLSHYAWPQTTLAQAQTPAPAAQTLPTHYFTFVDRNNDVQATFSVTVDLQGRRTNYLFKATNGRMASPSIPFGGRADLRFLACGN
jgi:hypothetical protein